MQPKPLIRTNYYTFNGKFIRAPKTPIMVIPIIKGVTPFSTHYNRAQKGPLAVIIEAIRF